MRRGFTLVEMLVATALVMLMMLLFAEIFGAAIGTITAQKGLANNDQKARSLVSILTHDLDDRTYRAAQTRGATKELVQDLLESPRGVVPLGQNDPVDERQQGYLYFSENDPDNDTDDVLQLTVSQADENAVPASFFGSAQRLTSITDAENQPENDDGVPDDGAASSRAAEVAYFMRGRNLYRRVMLIRQPLSNESGAGTQPEEDTGVEFVEFTAPYPGAESFYHDWDFSGTRVVDEDAGTVGTLEAEPTDTYRFHFHGIQSLSNLSGGDSYPLGIPWNRFGFYSRFGAPHNRPVEYLIDAGGVPTAYIGRFTHEETSHASFDWPGVESGVGTNIMTRTDDLLLSSDGIVSIDANTSGTVDPGEELAWVRTGEDLLLTNVESFDIEVWDTGYAEGDFDGSGAWDAFDPDDDLNQNGIQDSGAWVDLGHSLGTGTTLGPGLGLWGEGHNSTYGGNDTWGRQTANYGPGGTAAPAFNHVFDTWHPQAGIDTDGDGQVSTSEITTPPYRPLQVDPNDASNVTVDSNNPPAAWCNPPQVAAGSFFFPGSGGGTGIGYVVIQTGVGGPTEPKWLLNPGEIIREPSEAEVSTDLNDDSDLLDPGAVWQCFDNRIGLEQIRITVRYRDVSTGQARQVTIVHSLVD